MTIRKYSGWRVLASLSVIMMLTTGLLAYGTSVLNTRMVADWGLDRKSLGIAVSAYSLCMAVFSPIAGLLIHRWGARRALLIGTATLVVAASAMATVVHSLWQAVVFYGAVMGFGSALAGTIPVKTVVSYWFRRRLALAMTVTSIGTNVGGAIAAPLLAQVVATSAAGWRAGWWVIVGALSLSFLVAYFLVQNQPSDVGELIDGGESPRADPAAAVLVPRLYKTSQEWEFAALMRRPATWWMLLAIGASASTQVIAVVHGVAHFMDLGHSSQVAASTLGTMLAAQTVSRILYAGVGDYVEPRYIWSGSLALAAVGLLLALEATSASRLFASAVLIGLGVAPSILCFSAMAVNYFGRAPFSRFMGVAVLIQTGLSSAVAVLAGTSFDITGSYALIFYAFAALMALLGVGMPFVRAPAYATRSA